MPGIEPYLRKLVEARGDDLLLSPGERPRVRVAGTLRTLGAEDVVPEHASETLLKLASREKRELFKASGSATFACKVEGVGRFRICMSRGRRGDVVGARHIPEKPASFEDLGLPDAAATLCTQRAGLVVITGPKGAGKTTTLASMIASITRDRAVHIVTIEDPIEFLHEHGRALVNQRELGTHAPDFVEALRSARAVGADVILVGMLDEAAVAEETLRAANSGHLVLAEMGAATAVDAVRDLLALFPPARRSFARASLASCLRGVVAQRLLLRSDGKGCVAAFESLLASPVTAGAIHDAGGRGLHEAVRSGRRADMVFLDDALLELVASGTIEFEEAAAQACSEEEFRRKYASSPGEPREAEPATTGDVDNGEAPRKPAARVSRRLTRAEMFLVPMGVGAKKEGRSLQASFEGDSGTGKSVEMAEGEGSSLADGLLADPSIVAGRRVLVVDNDDQVRGMLERMLQSAGARVTAVSGADEALEAISSGDYDMGVFDILMPDISGIELYDRAAEIAPRLREKILFVTAHSPDGRLTDRIAARGGMLVRKPFGIGDLLKGAAVALRKGG